MTSLSLLDAEGVEQLGLRVDVVADGDEGKVGAVDAAGVGIDGAGPGGAVAGAEDVDADDEVVLESSRPPGAKSSGHQIATWAEPESAWQTSTALSRAALSLP